VLFPPPPVPPLYLILPILVVERPPAPPEVVPPADPPFAQVEDAAQDAPLNQVSVPAVGVPFPPAPTCIVALPPGVKLTFLVRAYAPPPPPPEPFVCISFPPPPPPITSTKFSVEFQSAGTLHEVPEVIYTVVSATVVGMYVITIIPSAPLPPVIPPPPPAP
jgi:hypothetical protein